MSYAHPEVLVDTQWVGDHMNDHEVRIAEVDYDPTANYNPVLYYLIGKRT
jgi:thiosulfate/3-mercaptopyruvate sulfurtransferase